MNSRQRMAARVLSLGPGKYLCVQPKTMYEYACHEGSYALMGILTAARLHESEFSR